MSTKQVYRNGIWTLYESTTHERVAPFAPILFYEEFLGTTLVAGATIWTAKDIHAEATEANIADQHGGVFGMGIGATDAEQEAGLTMGDHLNFNLDKGPIIEFVAALHTLPTLLAEIYFGIGNNYTKGTLAAADQGPTIHAAFMFDGSGVCTLHTDDNGGEDNNAVATGVTILADIYHVFRIDFTTITDVLFFIDGVNVGTAGLSMANGADVVVQPYMMVYKSAGAGLGDLYVDSVKIWSKR
jgi:hypothetical protein